MCVVYFCYMSIVQLLAEAKLKFSVDFDGAALANFPSIADKLFNVMKMRKLTTPISDLIRSVDSTADSESRKGELLL